MILTVKEPTEFPETAPGTVRYQNYTLNAVNWLRGTPQTPNSGCAYLLSLPDIDSNTEIVIMPWPRSYDAVRMAGIQPQTQFLPGNQGFPTSFVILGLNEMPTEDITVDILVTKVVDGELEEENPDPRA